MIPEHAAGMKRDDWKDEWWEDPMADDFRECEGCHRMWPLEDLEKVIDRYWCESQDCRDTLAEDLRAIEEQAWVEKHARPGIDF